MGHGKLARISRTPGRTQTLNIYNVLPDAKGRDRGFYLVDMPGYGYASVSRSTRAEWGKLIVQYLQTRETLQAVVLLIDMRHPPQPLDLAMAALLRQAGRPFLVVATKADAVPRAARFRPGTEGRLDPADPRRVHRPLLLRDQGRVATSSGGASRNWRGAITPLRPTSPPDSDCSRTRAPSLGRASHSTVRQSPMHNAVKLLLAVTLLLALVPAIAEAQYKSPVYFAIIGSLPTREAAEHMVTQASRAGLAAQVSHSNRYPYLHPRALDRHRGARHEPCARAEDGRRGAQAGIPGRLRQASPLTPPLGRSRPHDWRWQWQRPGRRG